MILQRIAIALTFSIALTGCVAERLAPGPGPATPTFVDQGHWRARDGFVLGMSQWPVQDPKIVIAAVHGMNDYGRFIEQAATYWQAHGIATYSYDQRGFGRTEGNGRWAGHEVMAQDARTFVALVRARHPDARFQIVGARPVPSVRALARIDGVEVTGAVADVRPYVKGATVVVAPLRIARGIQNKVLEGMAMARPVVTSPAALEGINAEQERHVLVGETPNEFAAAVVRVLDAAVPADIGAAARAFVVKNHDWDANLKALDDVLLG